MDDKSQAFAALELTDVERELMRQFNRLDASGRELMLNEARHYLHCQQQGMTLADTVATSPITAHLAAMGNGVGR